MSIFGKVVDATKAVAGVFTSKNKMKEQISTNKKEVKVTENTSSDKVVRRWKIILVYIIAFVIILDYFGLRVLILRKAGIEVDPVDYKLIFNTLINAFNSLITI